MKLKEGGEMKQKSKIIIKWISFTILVAIAVGSVSYFIWAEYNDQISLGYTESWNSQSVDIQPDIPLSLLR